MQHFFRDFPLSGIFSSSNRLAITSYYLSKHIMIEDIYTRPVAELLRRYIMRLPEAVDDRVISEAEARRIIKRSQKVIAQLDADWSFYDLMVKDTGDWPNNASNALLKVMAKLQDAYIFMPHVLIPNRSSTNNVKDQIIALFSPGGGNVLRHFGKSNMAYLFTPPSLMTTAEKNSRDLGFKLGVFRCYQGTRTMPLSADYIDLVNAGEASQLTNSYFIIANGLTCVQGNPDTCEDLDNENDFCAIINNECGGGSFVSEALTDDTQLVDVDSAKKS